MRMKQKMNGKMRIDKGVQIFFYILLVILSLSLLVPVIWMLMNSFKGNIEYYQKPTFSLPESLDFDNYAFFLNNIKYEVKRPEGTYVYTLPWMFMYSIIWAVVPSAFSILVTTMCAYVIARYKFPGRNFLYAFALVIMMIPTMGSLAASYRLYINLGLYNTYFGIFIMYLGGFSSSFLFLYGFFKGLSWTYAEAAFVDGAGHFRTFFTIMLPIAFPAIGAVAVLAAINIWNDYFNVYLFAPLKATVAVGLNYVQGAISGGRVGYPHLFALIILSMIPILVIFVLFQRTIMDKMAMGGIKG